METALRRINDLRSQQHVTTVDHGLEEQLSASLSSLASVLRDGLPLLHKQSAAQIIKPDESSSSVTSSVATSTWLLNLCEQVPSELGASNLARAVLEASRLSNETEQQAALFDALGPSEQAMEALLEIAPRLLEISNHVRFEDLSVDSSLRRDDHLAAATTVDLEAERRQLILQEAQDAAHIAAIAKAEVEVMTQPHQQPGGSNSFGATHTVTRASEKQARKYAEKAAKRAAQALQRAKDAGAILDESELLSMMDQTALRGDGGLANRSQEEIRLLQQSLMAEGSRQYYDERGLPHGAIREQVDDLEKVIIPPARQDKASLHARLNIQDILDHDSAQAFQGTASLNPMQSSVFEAAFHSRVNLLVCAPTGAGKTNVAMLTVAAHFRDVGLTGDSRIQQIDTGKKVVYIAPMKALAQEVVEKFSSKLKPLRLIVRELTGDMQLTKAEAESANVLVTTPEKWDVVTRKSGTDENALGNQCGLLIIDEVHLLADERGAVIESVVSRLHRLVESRQRLVRIVGLSATLPNYKDCAEFLHVPEKGLFFFGPEHRPVPLQQQFIGIASKSKDRFKQEKRMNEVCYDIVIDSLIRGYQVMVFVHSRKGTGDTAKALADIASQEGSLEKYFITKGKEGPAGDAHKRYADRVNKSRNREVGNHFENGLGIHHAGMLRGDRKITEQMFNDGAIKVLCCTATLAWGINLPAHTVVIKGTDVYNPEKGGIVDLSILDVQQIFGRAGRPQFDTSGEATLITSHDAFTRYIDKLVRAVPIESNFINQLADHLNAEVVGGTVSNLKEAVQWLTYTYLYVRMLRNPLAYGISADQKADDPMLKGRCLELVSEAASLLDRNKMLRFSKDSGNLSVAERGRVAAHFYIQAESVANFDERLQFKISPSDADLFRVICSAAEFKNVRVRQEEMDELTEIAAKCPLAIKGAGQDDSGQGLITDAVDKSFILMQALISRERIRSFTLITDTNYISSNAARVARAIFEMSLKSNESSRAMKLLRIAKSVDNRFWWFQTPLRAFVGELRENVLSSLENHFSGRHGYDTFAAALSLLDMTPKEVGQLCHWNRGGDKVQNLVRMLPYLEISYKVLPMSASVLTFHVVLTPTFEWHGRWHGGAESFWFWVEDGETNRIFHHEYIVLSKRTFPDPITLDFAIPAFDPLPKQYNIIVISERWVGVEMWHPVSFNSIQMPSERTPYTDLQDLTPLPTSALQEAKYSKLYSKFDNFNPIQTQLFHVLYHTDSPVIVGAPTGSGKTIIAELAILRMKRIDPKSICVYIAPLKSLARERLKEWQKRLGSSPLNWSVLELSGDTSHDQRTLDRADICVATPEKWDLISRGWKGTADASTGSNARNGRAFVKKVRLLILDEVHLLGEDRGAVLEAIVSRTRLISGVVRQEQMEKSGSDGASAQNGQQNELTRIVGLSTALANPLDLADWVGIDTTGIGPRAKRGMYNFRASVRPVPMVVHVQGYPGRHYCPRMATMNKPCFSAIKDISPTKPVLIFVASRRQTRLTAFDLISYAAADENPKRFLGCSEALVESVAENIVDDALRHTITFGIGLHHAGLCSSDRDIVEKMFLKCEIQVLVATATLAWGVNLPAHLVIVKGTEYYDGKTSRYVDYPVTDVLQMIGRAGRPGFDNRGEAVVMVQEDKKNFYKKFLYSPFPVESCLGERMCESINAEIASGTISSFAEAVAYLMWTFFARRVKANPSYYGAASSSEEDVEALMITVIKEALAELRKYGCVNFSAEESDDISPTILGQVACNYYLTCRTPKQMQVGVREARKLVLNTIESSTSPSGEKSQGSEAQPYPFTRPVRVDEISAAWLLYVLSSTHEFDEIPVRHNEEHLNQELSKQVMWGPDTSSILDPNGNRQVHDNSIFEDPHTKCFLLLQAHLSGTKLPISDYVGDTKSIVENIPRLLAAMQCIAMEDKTTAGTFELISQFCRTKQLLKTRSTVADDPLLQLPGFTKDLVNRMKQDTKSNKDGVDSISKLRSLDRKEVESMMHRLTRGKKKMTISGMLYALPEIRILGGLKVVHGADKSTGKSIGKLKVDIEILRDQPGNRRNRKDDGYTLNIILGSLHQRTLLAHSTVRLSKFGRWKISRDLTFDWSSARADGNRVILRLLFDEVRGFDLEATADIS